MKSGRAPKRRSAAPKESKDGRSAKARSLSFMRVSTKGSRTLKTQPVVLPRKGGGGKAVKTAIEVAKGQDTRARREVVVAKARVTQALRKMAVAKGRVTRALREKTRAVPPLSTAPSSAGANQSRQAPMSSDKLDAMRRVCFGQGKACVYEPDDLEGVVITEWPNGVIDKHHVEEERIMRCWPDGREEQFASSATQAHKYPHV